QKLDTMPFDKEVIVTDVRSVKGSVLDAANQLTNEHIVFIGGDPMAGSHKSGIHAANSHLCENAIYILTPTASCATAQLYTLKKVLQHTNAYCLILKPDEHDEMTSVV